MMIRVPTPFQVGDINVYRVGDTLIDTGPGTAGALTILEKTDITSVKNVLITHGHVDHHGLAYYVKKKAGCTVFVHEDDADAVSDYGSSLMKKLEKYKEFLVKSGISQKFISQFELLYKSYGNYGEDCEVAFLGDVVETEEDTVQVIHTPGHTPGSCCFLMGKTLYSGDTLLPHISTNTSIHALFDERCGLEPFQRSLKTIAQLDVEKVFPGHGNTIRDYRTRIDQILEEYNKRKEKIVLCLSSDGCTLAEITKKVFGTLPASEVVLALAECYDHLKILEREGAVKGLEKDKYYFKKS
jgi:glyoxylase-like metal-dependent hydrolase (beta-lactamase superfamily II)